MPFRLRARYYEDIVENIALIRSYTDGFDEERFATESMCRDAVQHCLLRISEAARVLGRHAEADIPALPWRDIRALGNRLRHEYQRIDARLVWRIVENDLDVLDAAVRGLLAQGGADTTQ